MALRRTQLPIASPCGGFTGTPATDDAPAFCTRCSKPVHDLSRLTEDGVVDLLARHLGGRVCVSYRVREDGRIVTRKPPSKVAAASLTLSLAACAGHVTERDRTADPECMDRDGYLGACPSPDRLADAVIPEAPAPIAAEPDEGDGEAIAAPELAPTVPVEPVDEVVAVHTVAGGIGIAPEAPALQTFAAVEEDALMGEYVPDDGGLAERVRRRHRELSRAEERAAKRAARAERRDARRD